MASAGTYCMYYGVKFWQSVVPALLHSLHVPSVRHPGVGTSYVLGTVQYVPGVHVTGSRYGVYTHELKSIRCVETGFQTKNSIESIDYVLRTEDRVPLYIMVYTKRTRYVRT